MELGTRHRRGEAGKGLVEIRQIIVHRLHRKRILHAADAAGRGAFHFLHRAVERHRVKFPLARRRRPVERAVFHPGGQVNLFALIRKRHQALQPAYRQRGLQLAAARDIIALHDDLRRGFIGRHVRPAERPARAGGHVHAQADPLRLGGRVREHLHPFRREKINEAVLVTFRAVNRADFHAADARVVKFRKHQREIGFVHRAAEPPPARPRMVRARGGWPAERVIGGGS